VTKAQDMPRPADNRPPARKPYRKPELQQYGDLADLTQTIAGSKTRDGSGHPNKHFTS
jgi:hypothetical protein